MTKFEDTNLGLTVMEDELTLLRYALAQKLADIGRHPAVSKTRKREVTRELEKVSGAVQQTELIRRLGKTDQLRDLNKDVTKVLNNIAIRKAEDSDEP